MNIQKNFQYMTVLSLIWITFLMITTFTSLKVVNILGFEFNIGTLNYPFTYIISALLTEVYGFKETRKVIKTGFICLIIFSVFGYLYSVMESATSFKDNDAFSLIFKSSPGVVFSTLVGFYLGESTSSYTIARLKVLSSGKKQWLRLIAAAIVGQSIDNSLFFSLTHITTDFYELSQIPRMIISATVFCILVQTILIPLTKKLSDWLKVVEGVDVYESGTLNLV